MFNEVLVLLDGSPLAESALPHTTLISDAFESRVSFLRVLEAEEASEQTRIDPVNWHLRKVEAQAYLNGLVESRDATTAMPQAVLEEGSAVERIIDYVEDNEPDLIVLSSHGQSGLSPHSISSVAQKIIHRVPRSFMLVRAYEEQMGQSLGRYRRIMVPLDGSRRAEYVLPYAARLASAHDAELLLVHVVPPADLIQPQSLSAEESDLYSQLHDHHTAEASRYLSQVSSYADLPTTTHLLTDRHVADALIDFTDAEEIDLVMMCAHGQSGENSRRYGSNVNALLNYGSGALFVVQDLPEDQIKSTKAELAAANATGDTQRKTVYAQPANWNPYQQS